MSSFPAPRAVFLVLVGGAVGSIARLGLWDWATGAGVASWNATWIINVLGCALMGAVIARVPAQTTVREFVGVGVLGGFTTFSAFSVDTVELLTSGLYATAALYAFGGIATCLAGLWLGEFLARRRTT